MAVEMKSSAQTCEVTVNYELGKLIDTNGRYHSVQLVMHPNGSVTWRDSTYHIQ